MFELFVIDELFKLDGDSNERLEIVLNDNFTGLLSHHFFVHGLKWKN